MRLLTLVAPVGLSATLQAPAVAQFQQRFADLGTCPPSRGEVVRECRVGYRTYGRLSHMAPTCETETIDTHVRVYLDGDPDLAAK